MHSVIVHIMSEDPVLGEIEELPQKTDTLVLVKNPRRRDGKDLPYLDGNVSSVYWPIHRISFIEVVPGVKDEDIISFVRE